MVYYITIYYIIYYMVKFRTTLKHKKKNIKKYSNKNKRNKNKKTTKQKKYYKKRKYSRKMIGGTVCLQNGECLKLVGTVKGTGNNISGDVVMGLSQNPVGETVQQKLPEKSTSFNSLLNKVGYETNKWRHIDGKNHFYQYPISQVLFGIQRKKSSPTETSSPVVTTTETPTESVTEIDQQDITQNGINGTNKKDELIQSNNLITVNKNNMSGEEEENNTINPNLTLIPEQRPPLPPPPTTELEVKQHETNLTPEVEQDMNLNTDNNVVTDDSKNDMEKKDDSLINISSEEIFNSEQSKQPNESPENLKKILKQEVDTLNTVNQESTPPKKVNFWKRVNEAKKDVQNEEKPINVEQNVPGIPLATNVDDSTNIPPPPPPRRRLSKSRQNPSGNIDTKILEKYSPIVVSKDDTNITNNRRKNTTLKRRKSMSNINDVTNVTDLQNVEKGKPKIAWSNITMKQSSNDDTNNQNNNVKEKQKEGTLVENDNNVKDFTIEPEAESKEEVETEYGKTGEYNQYDNIRGGKIRRRRSRKMKIKKKKSRNTRKIKKNKKTTK